MVPVRIGIAKPLKEHLAQAGKPIPNDQDVEALIDTGATVTMIDLGMAKMLGLQPVRAIPLATAGGSYRAPVFEISLGFLYPPQPEPRVWLEATPAAGGPLAGSNYLCLIGRDILANSVFVYDGVGANITLSF
jgi:hypothetical protein